MNIYKHYLLSFLFISSTVSFAQRAIDGNKIINANTIVNEYTTLTTNAIAGATTITVGSSDLNANNRFGVTSVANSLNAGDLIMIIQMQGPSSTTTSSIEFPAGSGQFYGFPNDSTWGQTTSYNNCGHYEFCEVSAVPSLTTITVDCGLKYDYTAAGRVQVIRVPRYKTLTITNPGILTCPAWATGGIFTGGIVAVEVYGNTTIGAGASISASALGFRGGSKIGDNASGLGGGQVARSSNTEGAEKGEGIFGYQADYDVMAGRYCRGVAGNGGGGGDMHNAGGGGGSNAGSLVGWDGKGNPDNTSVLTWNTAWNLEGFGMSSSHTSPGGGRGGYSFSSQNRNALTEGPKPFQSGAATNLWMGDYRENNGGWGGRPLDYTTGRLFIGGGGGAGDQDNGCAGNGGIGGGMVYFMSYGTISGTGTIVANGGAGANTNTSGLSVGIDGAGGGGGGGTIILNSVGTISGISASANGGAGGNQNVTGNEAEGPGGGGGGGYIALSTGAIATTVNGGTNGVTNSPALTEFPPNGATMGAAGLTNQLITYDTVFAANVTICSGNTASLTATIYGTVPVGTTISWYTTQTGGAPIGSGSPFVTPALVATTTYYVGFCPGTYRIPVIVTVNTSPTASNAGVNQSVCAASATLAGNTPLAGTGTWTLVSGTGTITTPTSPTSTVTGLGLGANIFQWTISNPPCGTSSTQVTITSTGGPTTSVAGLPQTVCGTTATLAGNTPTTGTGLWTLLSGIGTITTPTSPTSGVTGLGVGPNVFQWTITSAPCPASTSSVTITGVAAPTVSNAGPVQTVCGTTATLAGNTATAGTGLWTLVSGTGTITAPASPTSGITGLAVGPNVFQWTISNVPCVASSSTVTITGVAAPTASNAGINQSVCATSSTFAGNSPLTGTGAWTLVSGTGVITTPSSPTSTVTGLGLGANVFQWTISNPPCVSSSTQVTITSTGGPTTSVAGLPQTVCGTTSTLAGNTPTTGTGLWTLLSGTGTITTPSSPTSGVTGLGIGPNVFQWTITSAPCPTSTSSVTITGVAAPTVSNAGPVQTVCGTTATLAGNIATTGTGIWTLVSGTGTITTTASPTSGITGLGVGPNVFQWTISNAPCVASSSTVTINGVAAPTASNAGPVQTVCGTTATLAGNTATTGTGIWTLISGAGTITTPTSPTSGVTGLGVGANVFQWTISNAPCVASSSTVTINGVAAPTVSNAGPVQTVCGTTATLAGNIATTGTGIWTLVSGTGTITTTASPTSGITGLGVGPNVFQWTISNAPCVASFSTVTITGVAAPTISIAGPPQSVCATSATLAGNAPTTGTGTWTLVSGTGTITTPSSPTSGITGLGLGANVFQWTIDNPPCAPSTNTVTITSTGGATTSAAGPDQSVCGTSATLSGNTPIVGTGLWTLVSGTGAITSPSSPTSGVTGLGIGANVFQWTITSFPCPPSTSIVTITNTGSVTTSLAGSSQTICGTIATLAGNTPIVGTGTWTLVSGTGTITTPSSPTSGITGLGVGANVFQWTITSASCPPSSSTVTITGVAAPTISIAGPNQTICSTSALLAANAPTTGTGTWTLVSGSGTITTPSSPTSTVTGLGLGANVFQWTIDNPPCTPSFTTVAITNTGGPSINATSQTNVSCNGGSNASATVAGSGGAGSYTYSWTGGAGTSGSASGLSAGTYTVTVTDGAGCSSTTFVNITEPLAISGSVNTTSANCGSNDGSATATIAGGSGTFTYLWAPGGATTSSITSIGTGIYTVTVTDSLGCTFVTSGTVSSIGGPAVNAGTDVTITSGSSTVLTGTASIGATYSWTPPITLSCNTCASPIASPTQTTTYILTVTLSGCSSSDTITVFVEEECGELFVPNVFSPNGDGVNDSLKIYGGCIKDLEFVIFDRWGEKVFETTDPTIVWDGTLHGKRLDAAIFVYYLNATIKGIEVKKHGNITLVK